ncbi:hypothetical protein Pmani_008409 [Petrolisthes manimaculis]|uniref:BTB domain-containing protein n=1 Tax=Petrolisthes manimaculis TaxID=1843537 RepID=A0AAE1Q6D9_9EUCA|nr:hypothetical protein Pmani_008409 [Petrolisthes manimaculis]
MGENESVSVKWDHHQPVLLQAIKEIYTKEIFADVRLECDGHEHWAHKFILSACSEYFQEILVDVPHRGSVTVSSYVQHKQLVSLLDFMYLGEVIVPQEELAELVNAAEVLMVRGMPEEEDVNKVFIKERRMMGQGQQGMGDISVKEEPLDPDYTDRFHYPGSQSNRFHQNMPMPGGDMGQNNPNDGMNTRQGPDVNGGNTSTDINNLLNVLIDSPSNRGQENKGGNDPNPQDQGTANPNQMASEPAMGGKDYGSLKSHLKKHAPQIVPSIFISQSSSQQIISQGVSPQLSSPQLSSPQLSSPQLSSPPPQPPPQVGIEQRLS